MRRIAEFQVPWPGAASTGVYECQLDGVTYYLLDNEYYFKRDSVYGDFDDGERFAFFSKAALEMLATSTLPRTSFTATIGSPPWLS